MIKNHQTIVRIVLLAGILYALLITVLPPVPIQANLPPRYTPTPVRQSDSDAGSNKPVGAYIELQVQSSQGELWTVVQWQDSAGIWHNVDGWRGTLETGGYKRWWVAAKDFNKGSFRWMVYRSQGGPQLATSTLFQLPGKANEIVQIEVSLAPKN